MFRFPKTLDIVTLFHKASSPASVRVAALLQKASESASQTAVEDKAASSAATVVRDPFELNISEDAPTTDQLRTILEYVGTPAIPSVVRGAHTTAEALKKFKESADNFQRPVVVDWNNGKATAGANESEIIKLLNSDKA